MTEGVRVDVHLHGDDLADALAATIEAITARTSGRLNLLMTDGHRVAASAWGNSLFACSAPGPSTWVASEPLDEDPNWVRIPDRSLVEVDAAGMWRVLPL